MLSFNIKVKFLKKKLFFIKYNVKILHIHKHINNDTIIM